MDSGVPQRERRGCSDRRRLARRVAVMVCSWEAFEPNTQNGAGVRAFLYILLLFTSACGGLNVSKGPPVAASAIVGHRPSTGRYFPGPGTRKQSVHKMSGSPGSIDCLLRAADGVRGANAPSFSRIHASILEAVGCSVRMAKVPVRSGATSDGSDSIQSGKNSVEADGNQA